ncbi:MULTISPECIES: hypothetical protein [unclassified Marinobacter]|uniref:hypothetical protein n=1 Tax=unclassified Marinobacter TaxID=83889 RepID=UPI001928CA0E|nr:MULTISPECIES: hypothetical protein [unclassified Marinobacter]MBL3825160.1 hypothetical protein [Marinobacter sp. MC3]MBL3893636.1 hypothetical protein [Marinobacter sp. MW3]
MSQKKFEEYESNPGALDVDEDNVDSLINQLGQDSEAEDDTGTDDAETNTASDDSDEKAKADADETKVEEDDKAAAAQEEQKAEEQGEKDDEPPRVVKTRDGKHEIPYSVLERERQKNLDLQRQLDEVKRQQQESREKAPETKDDQNAGQSADKDDFDLEAFREEFGDEAAEAERKRRQKYADMEKRQAQLEKEIEDNRKWREQQEAKAKQTVESEITEAIDSIPELRDWRDKEDPMWDAAVALDNRLMNDPEFADLPYRDRFVKVVERLTGRTLSDKKTDHKSAEAALDKTLAEQERTGGKPPSSLSDIPGGHAADQSEQDTLERMTTAQLERKFESMTPEQQSEYLARL